jgi:hypothetical protein
MSVFRDQLHVSETEGKRFDLFLDLLASGEVVVFQEIALAIRNGTLEVDVPSAQRSGRETEERARREFDAAAVTVETLTQPESRVEERPHEHANADEADPLTPSHPRPQSGTHRPASAMAPRLRGNDGFLLVRMR